MLAKHVNPLSSIQCDNYNKKHNLMQQNETKVCKFNLSLDTASGEKTPELQVSNTYLIQSADSASRGFGSTESHPKTNATAVEIRHQFLHLKHHNLFVLNTGIRNHLHHAWRGPFYQSQLP